MRSVDSSFRNRLFAGFVAMLSVIAGGTLGYWLIGDGRWAWSDCLYMTVITVTTVGYGEVLSGMEDVAYARGYTMGLLVFGTGVLVYFASTITAFIVEGELTRVLASNRLRKRIKRMKDHIVVCGAGSTGGHIIEELLKTGTPVIAIDRNEVELQDLASRYPKAPFTYLVGDATDDDLLAQANLEAARGLVAALSEDKDNLYLVVATRQTNPQMRIISRCTELSHIDKLKRAGADSVVSPNFIGGMRMVSEMVRPSVVRFMDDMLRDQRAAYRIEEVTIGGGSPLDGKTLAGADVRGRFGMGVIAVKAGEEPWTYNPEPDTTMKPGMILVVVGSADQVKKLRAEART
jgi:voltage-gated potassium channel